MTPKFRSSQLRILGNVYAGADAGVYDLPSNVQAALAALDRLATERARFDALPAPTEMDLAAMVTAAAKSPKVAFPNGNINASAELERRSHAVYGTALVAAAEPLEDALETATVGAAEATITDHLRPAMTTVMAELGDIFGLLRPHGTDHAALLEAPEAARKARLRLDAVAARYQTLRDAQGALARVMAPAPSENGRLFEVRDFSALAAGYRPGVIPWPTGDVVGKLWWFLTNGAIVWMPTPAEREAAYLADAEASKKARDDEAADAAARRASDQQAEADRRHAAKASA